MNSRQPVAERKPRGARTFAWQAAWLLVIAACVAVVLFVQRREDASSTEANANAPVSRHRSVTEIVSEKSSGALEGRVETNAGAPVEGARVCATRATYDLASAPARCVVTDEHGAFQVEGLMGGLYAVGAQAAGFASAFVNDGEGIRVGRETVQDVHIRLAQATPNLRGEVRDAVGGVVPGARVRAMRVQYPLFSVELETDLEGRFALHVPEGAITLSATAEGYTPIERAVTVPAQQVQLTLTPAASISGWVQLADGTPVSGVEVRALGAVAAGTIANLLVARSDEDGEFSLRGLPPGIYQLRAKGSQYQGGSPEPIQVDLGAAVKDARVLVQSAALVTGEVRVSGSGEPCERGVMVLGAMPDPTQPFPVEFEQVGRQKTPVAPQMAAIRGDGKVVFEGVPAGTYYVSLRCDGHVLSAGPRSVAVDAQSTVFGPFAWEVSPAITLKVRVVDDAGAAVPYAPVRLIFPPPAPGLGRALVPLVGDGNGRAEMRGLSPGSYLLQAQDPTVGPSIELHLSAQALAVEKTLQLFGSGSVVVSVKDGSGAALDEVQVVANPVDSNPAEGAAPGGAAGPLTQSARLGVAVGAGKFRIAPLSEGRYQVSVADGVNAPVGVRDPRALVQVRARSQAELTLTLDRGASIEGRVTSAQGAVVPNAWVSARAEDGPDRDMGASVYADPSMGRVLTDLEGHFVLQGLSASGRYRLHAEQSNGSEVSLAGVAPGQGVTLSLPPTARIEGEIRDEQGTPAPALVVQATSADGQVQRQARLTDGGRRFVLEHFPAGEVEIVAADQAGRLAREHQMISARDTSTRMILALRTPGPPTEERVEHASGEETPRALESEPNHSAIHAP